MNAGGTDDTRRVDPVRQRHIDALARRAAQHQGAARLVMEQRLQALRARSEAPVPAPTLPPRRSPLALLLDQLARQAPPPGELKAVRDYRGTWARLGMEQRLTQTLAKVPDNAGPLNTQRLLHQALTVMRAASPQYLQHFMSHVEALLVLEQMNQGATPAKKKDAARGGNASR